MQKEIWRLNLSCAIRYLKKKLSLSELNTLYDNGITDITKNNIVQICKEKNIELILIEE